MRQVDSNYSRSSIFRIPVDWYSHPLAVRALEPRQSDVAQLAGFGGSHRNEVSQSRDGG